MTLGQKLRTLRQLEGPLRGLDREMTQSEVARAIRQELHGTISQSYLSLIEKGTRPHLSHSSRQLLAKFFKVHPGYLVSDPPGFHYELASPVGSDERTVDRWLLDGAARLAADAPLSAALERLAARADSRRCLMLLDEMATMPGLLDRLSDTLLPRQSRTAPGDDSSRPTVRRGGSATEERT